MSVPETFNAVITFMSDAVSRIFGLDDDDYPNTGVQPFSGETYDKRHPPD